MLSIKPYFEGLVSTCYLRCYRIGLSKCRVYAAPPLQACASEILCTHQVQMINFGESCALTSFTRDLGEKFPT